jgi:(R)-2-hydroxyglutarate---pyruvate transhydrogenase
MDQASLRFVETQTTARVPIDNTLPFYVLVETQSAADQTERLEAYMAHCLDRGLAADATIAQNEGQVGPVCARTHTDASAFAHKGLCIHMHTYTHTSRQCFVDTDRGGGGD